MSIENKNSNIINATNEITLGDFVDDLTVKKLTSATSSSKLSKIINICEHGEKINVLSFIPKEWLVSSSYSSSMITYLRKADPQGYKTGEYIHDVFFANPTKCKKILVEHITNLINNENILFNKELFKEYIYSIIEIKNGMNNYIGDGDIRENIKTKILKLLEQKFFAEIISLFILSFIIMPLYPYTNNRIKVITPREKADEENNIMGSIVITEPDKIKETIEIIKKKDTDNAKLVFDLIWFSENEIVNKEKNFNIGDYNNYQIYYAYALSNYNQNKYECSFDIIKTIRNKPQNHILKIDYYCLYVQHLLLGRGTTKNVRKALMELLKIFPSLFETDEKLEKQENNINEIDDENTGTENYIDEITKTEKDIGKVKRAKLISLIEDIVSFKYGKLSKKDISGDCLRKLMRSEYLSADLFSDKENFSVSSKIDRDTIDICYNYALFLLFSNRIVDNKKYAKSCFEFIVSSINIYDIKNAKDVKENTINKYINIAKKSKEYLSQLNRKLDNLSKQNVNTTKEQPLDSRTNTLHELLVNQLTNEKKVFLSNINANDNECFFTNSNSEITNIFLRKYIDSEIMNLDEMKTQLLSKAIYQKVSVVLFSENEQKNLDDCLELICDFFDSVNSEEPHIKLIQKNLSIYLFANYDIASVMIDAALNSKSGYLKIHICDYNKLASQQLIINAPLFIPNLLEDYNSNIVVFGTNDSTFQLAKEIIATAYFRGAPSLTMIGDQANRYRNKLEQLSPGVYKENERINRIKPEFYNHDIKELDFIDLFSNPLNDINVSFRNRLYRGNYFIVDIGNDIDNIMFAIKLRGWLLSCDPMFQRTPFIAVKCKSGRNANIAKHLVVNNKKAGEDNFNNYNLYFYGVKEDLFNSDNLNIETNKMQQKALNIHLSYWGKNLSEEDKENAIKSYYKFSYNRDSSECASISIDYMLYSLGVIKKIEDLCWSDEEKKDEYKKWLSCSGNTHIAARYEHQRWVSFMLSRGWRSATLEQVEAYAGQETGSEHKHLLCKLHPFICNWEDFDDDSEEDVKIRALQNKITGLNTPKDSTYNIVKAIGEILTKNPFEKIKDITEESR